MLTHSLLDFNLHPPANAAWFAVCAAIALHRGASQGEVREMAIAAERSWPKSAGV